MSSSVVVSLAVNWLCVPTFEYSFIWVLLGLTAFGLTLFALTPWLWRSDRDGKAGGPGCRVDSLLQGERWTSTCGTSRLSSGQGDPGEARQRTSGRPLRHSPNPESWVPGVSQAGRSELLPGGKADIVDWNARPPVSTGWPVRPVLAPDCLRPRSRGSALLLSTMNALHHDVRLTLHNVRYNGHCVCWSLHCFVS